MQTPPSHPKPVTEFWKPELTRLPRLHFARRFFRAFVRRVCRIVILVCTRVGVEGLENFPHTGPALVVINHLGDADTPLLVGFVPAVLDTLGKIELYDFPLLGKLMDWYGIIWLHRGQPDRRAIRAALDGLAEGRIIVIAPEGRYSLTGELEEATFGAAFLALKAHVPVVPVALIGTENVNVYGHLRRLRRPLVKLKGGQPFVLAEQVGCRDAKREGTRQITPALAPGASVFALASLLPVEYRGIYQ